MRGSDPASAPCGVDFSALEQNFIHVIATDSKENR
jgi:hypothetical protein